ncbi:ThiF family adenylyltransferase [Streptosporangium sandarakinum]|uniref:Molybdopterin/thiamine biosynthesis adenylyltransferase n=1 Tax=Streptosporangium sandarakinum TaxID=1260955 RepID=A0A852V3A6_9ACTN|nr:ThiF family adenylyltransferase [Streptosporangium sandarakinum]NYF40345.1 molybdopterin/thiamine biosynthesis adenylyltransferase [Streptosporangium sandarakinum]
MRVALKECEWETVGEDLIVVFDAREATTLSDPDGQVAALLEELRRAPRTAAELSAALGGRGFRLSEEDVGRGLRGLDSLGLVEDADGRTLGDPDEDERHFSNLSFYGTHATLDRRRTGFLRSMREAHVLVLGVGGGGSSLVQCLAGLGVGEMTLVDQDRVEPRNFARQFLYHHADIGLSKAERAAAWVRDYDPGIKVNAVDRWVSAPEDLADLVPGVDLIAGGLDGHPHANLWANEAAVRAGVPYVLGGANRSQLMYLSVDPGRTACLACDYADRPAEDGPEGVAYRIAENMKLSNPLTGPMAMQVGSLLAFEAQRYLTGYEPPRAAGFRVTLDLRQGLVPEWQPLPKNPECPVCRLAPPRGDEAR